MPEDSYARLRSMMVQIVAAHAKAARELAGLADTNQRVLDAMETGPRQDFVPADVRGYAHSDGPLPISWGKTVLHHLITALMTELLGLESQMKVLEIGTGLGYHTAILSCLAGHVHTVEVVEELADEAGRRMQDFGYANELRKVGNGYDGWPERTPFDRIVAAVALELYRALDWAAQARQAHGLAGGPRRGAAIVCGR